MEQISIPEYIDSPPQFLIWEIDDVAPVLVGFALGAFIRYLTQNAWTWFLGVLIGVLMSYFYVKFKANRLPGTLAHILYRYTGLAPLNKVFNNGFLQRTNE